MPKHDPAHMEQLRDRAAQLLARDQLGRDFFARGIKRQLVGAVDLLDLLRAYARIDARQPASPPPVALAPVSRPVAAEPAPGPLLALMRGGGNG